MAQIGSAGSPLNLKLGQAARAKNPQVNYEMQLVYNSVHLLSQYLEVLRSELEGNDSQDPSESLKFLRKISVVAGQSIVPGNICSIHGNIAYKGVGTTDPVSVLEDPAVTVGSTGTREMFGVDDTQVYVAVSSAGAGQFVTLGVPNGVIKLSGAVCGQLVWGAGAKTILTSRTANTVPQYLVGRNFSGDGAVYLSNPLSTYSFVGGSYTWEGYWMPGYPNSGGGNFSYDRNFLFPIGVCVLNNFVMICPRVYSPSPVHSNFT